MIPDIIVQRFGVTKIVADCKYKRLEPDEYKNHDIYQLLSYCISTNVNRGLLIYPLHTIRGNDQISIRNTAIEIRQATIDLDGSIEEINQACDILANGVIEWAAG